MCIMFFSTFSSYLFGSNEQPLDGHMAPSVIEWLIIQIKIMKRYKKKATLVTLSYKSYQFFDRKKQYLKQP